MNIEFNYFLIMSLSDHFQSLFAFHTYHCILKITNCCLTRTIFPTLANDLISQWGDVWVFKCLNYGSWFPSPIQSILHWQSQMKFFRIHSLPWSEWIFPHWDCCPSLIVWACIAQKLPPGYSLRLRYCCFEGQVTFPESQMSCEGDACILLAWCTIPRSSRNEPR